MLERWTRVVIRYRFVVLACWLAVAAVGIFSAVRLPALLTTSLAVPGSSSEQADTTLARHFGENPEGTFTVVFRVDSTPVRTIPSSYPALTKRLAAAARMVPNAHATELHTAAGIVYGDIVTRLDLQHAERYADAVRRALTGPGPPAYVTGAPAIQHDLDPILAADLRKGEMIAVPVALLMLAVVLGLRGVLLVPLLFAGSTITAALGLVYVMAHAVLMVSYVPNLVELMGLGLAIDYSLLFVHRFREEVEDEDHVAASRVQAPASRIQAVDNAIVRTMETAGRSVFFSGTAVAIGLSAVLIMPVPFIRSLGIAGVVVPLVSIVAALTVQPALLSLLGSGGLRGRRVPGFGLARGVERRAWTRLARVVLRQPGIVLAGAAVVMAALASPAAWLQLTPGSLAALPQFTESARGLALLSDQVGAGAITPIEVVLDGGATGRARTPAASAATLRLARRLLQDPEVFVVEIGSKPPYVDASGRFARVTVAPRQAFGDEATQQLVTRLRQQLIPAAHFPAGFQVSTGGAPAQGVDFLARVYGTFPWIVLAVLALAYIVLLRAFRSLLLPAIALLLDAVSVAAAYGLLVLIFRFGAGAGLLGLYQVSQIEGWIPVLLFATLFGLSMDYQVFLVTRMREAWDQGAGNAGAVTHGLERTGRIVSAAAVIMVASFSGFVAGRVAGLQEFGAGLALGVLLDATVVRILLMPSLIALLGRWSWWLPTAVARVVGVSRPRLSPRAGDEVS